VYFFGYVICVLVCVHKGALAGGILGFAFPMWLSIGTYATKPNVMKPMVKSVACCGISNRTSSLTTLIAGVTAMNTTVSMITPKPEMYD
jgi:hypothetical protein